MCNIQKKIWIVGIGTGSREQLTVQAEKVIRESDCLIGAKRMLQLAREVWEAIEDQDMEAKQPVQVKEYQSDKIVQYIVEHPCYEKIVVLLSGDVGFYSGAKKLLHLLKESVPCEQYVLPGISSVVYMAAKLGVSWDDAKLISLHGTAQPFIQWIHRNRKTFLILGGKDAGTRLLTALRKYELPVTLSVGQNLSYENEVIKTGTLEQFTEEDMQGLSVAFIENRKPCEFCTPHLSDEEFIRGEVPMTKEEIRAMSIAKLQLTKEAVVYDVGAGTGSVSVEAGLSDPSIRVYAIEKNPKAIELLKGNRKKFKIDGMEIIEGMAPDVMRGLEPPTHVFVGGSSGNLCEIITSVREKNPHCRIVMNAISLETVQEVMNASDQGLLPNMEVIQISASRSRKLGRYHMMTGMNPVYIVSDGRS